MKRKAIIKKNLKKTDSQNIRFKNIYNLFQEIK